MRPLVGSLLLLAGGAAAESGLAPVCENITFQEHAYTVCEIDPEKDDIRMFLNDESGRPYGHFSRLADSLHSSGEQLLFAMNGGMYHPDRSPVGHYVEDGDEIMRVVANPGPGNFGMVPNGIFCVQGTRAWVFETTDYLREQPECRYATQSGPMLIVGGALHPRFFPESDSRYRRNGVGTNDDGTRVVFAMSDGIVNFHAFASLFRDGLGLPNALYLDGNISRLFDAGSQRNDRGFRMGPIIGVVAPADRRSH